MSNKDDLAELLQDNITDSLPLDPRRDEVREQVETATEALLAAGYHKPRIITTVEELDAVPIGSVIVDRDGDAWQRDSTGWTCTDRSLNTADQPSSSLVNILGPVTVIHEPAP